nr:hypothetical protein [Hyphomicrobium sp.]
MLKQAPSQHGALQRQIGPLALLFTGITGIIGSGWLFASLYAAQIAGPAAIISWLIGGGVALMLSLVYAELGGMLPLAGAIARIPYFLAWLDERLHGRLAVLDRLCRHGAHRGHGGAAVRLQLSAVADHGHRWRPRAYSARPRRRHRAAAHLRHHQPRRSALAGARQSAA